MRDESVTPALAEAIGLPVQNGTIIVEVAPDSPADRAGLRGASETILMDGRPVDVGGDVITNIDGQPVHSSNDLLDYIVWKAAPGQDVTLTIIRAGMAQNATVRLGVRPAILATLAPP